MIFVFRLERHNDKLFWAARTSDLDIAHIELNRELNLDAYEDMSTFGCAPFEPDDLIVQSGKRGCYINLESKEKK